MLSVSDFEPINEGLAGRKLALSALPPNIRAMTSDPKVSPSVLAALRSKDGIRLKELDRLVLDEEVDTADGLLPRGAEGTVVLVWRNGEAFEVEFTRPFPALVILKPNQVRRAARRAEA